MFNIYIFIAVALIALVDFVPKFFNSFKKPTLVVTRYTRKPDFLIMPTVYGDIKYLDNITFLKKYAKNTLIYTSDHESVEFYKDLRIPLTHLVPNKEERLNQIKLISFKKVYNGVRYGWWSYLRILRGLNLMNDDFDTNWRNICGKGLNPEMFIEDHPDNLK